MPLLRASAQLFGALLDHVDGRPGPFRARDPPPSLVPFASAATRSVFGQQEDHHGSLLQALPHSCPPTAGWPCLVIETRRPASRTRLLARDRGRGRGYSSRSEPAPARTSHPVHEFVFLWRPLRASGRPEGGPGPTRRLQAATRASQNRSAAR